MLPIRWQTEAQADLATILAYIAERNQQAATDLYNEIDRAVSQLPHHPNLYRPGRVADTREMVVHSNYVIVYRVGTTAIEILSVMHTRQQYP
ncbi:type II toxin-antitoxin system RelE/ParE family toxin [Rugamonas rivuli]|uniref:Type II toxin-antitoxin system mRNA interferase toxin, RelE/StbE family n=1 Tax=Rugamonas rivuli TaxID=2743358 RepID=A0A843SD52_9BURK|nr:type II toxin-antitoxin system RelE/ParE family toxin [Rugamonas rivuli]MQA20982.1 type II toxin-antitoxin system mRNA interferase toxin, RelE/StbE family [Rugamonas rivuli]